MLDLQENTPRIGLFRIPGQLPPDLILLRIRQGIRRQNLPLCVQKAHVLHALVRHRKETDFRRCLLPVLAGQQEGTRGRRHRLSGSQQAGHRLLQGTQRPAFRHDQNHRQHNSDNQQHKRQRRQQTVPFSRPLREGRPFGITPSCIRSFPPVSVCVFPLTAFLRQPRPARFAHTAPLRVIHSHSSGRIAHPLLRVPGPWPLTGILTRAFRPGTDSARLPRNLPSGGILPGSFHPKPALACLARHRLRLPLPVAVCHFPRGFAAGPQGGL